MLTSGHGKYSEVADEKEFFEATKKSNKVFFLVVKSCLGFVEKG